MELSNNLANQPTCMYEILSYTHKCGRSTCDPPLAPMKDRRVDVAVASITETALIAMLLKGRNVLGEFGGFPSWITGKVGEDPIQNIESKHLGE